MLTTAPTFDHLYGLFPGSDDRPSAEVVSAADVPEPYRGLLDHTHHMTVTVEAFYRDAVDVRVLGVRHDGAEYARKILLTLRSAPHRVVQFGLVRIDLGVCPAAVRAAIVEGKTPLGRVLIENDMLRHIRLVALLRVTLGAGMAEWFGAPAGTVTYGRIGLIYTGDRPAVEVLEILAPVPAARP